MISVLFFDLIKKHVDLQYLCPWFITAIPVQMSSKRNCRSRSHIRQSVKTGSRFRSRFRTREQSRTSLRGMLKSLKNKKLRKNTIKNLTPILSTVHGIRGNYKWWQIY